MNNKKEKFIQAAVFGAILSAILVFVLTVVGELFAPLKDFLKNSYGHHWVGKGIWAVLSFVIVAFFSYFFEKNTSLSSVAKTIRVLAWTLVVLSVAIILFFVYEFTQH